MLPLLDELYESILKYVASTDRLLGPPILKRSSRDRYSICSGNFFPRNSNDLSPVVNEVSELVEKAIKSHIGSSGELISSLIRKGEIWDSGKNYFEIMGGSHFEVYCFTCKSLTFVRVQHEKMLYPPQREWLSIDVDENHDTLWLAEPHGGPKTFSK
jgi:hypothetical protein